MDRTVIDPKFLDPQRIRVEVLEETNRQQRRAYKTAERVLHARIDKLEVFARRVAAWRRSLHADTLLAQPDEEDLDALLREVAV